jgi:tryptophan synthase alpha chain
MENRLTNFFSVDRKNLLSIFFTAGFPRLEDTPTVALALQEAGVDLIEIGIPFSDPLADGPVIQQSNKVALDNGMTVPLLLKQVTALRQQVQLPILLMGYLNPVLQYGFERFLQDAATAGVDGLIFPDLPLAEYETNYLALFQQHQLSHVFLITPTTNEERLAHIDRLSTSFIYAVSASSTTGARNDFSDDQLAYFERLQKRSFRHPLLVGFGISNRQTFQTVCRYAAGGIIGSAFINLLAASKDLPSDIREFVHSLRN